MEHWQPFDGPPDLWPEYTDDSFKPAARLREEMRMSDAPMTSAKIDDEIRLPVARRLEIKIADNGMVVVGSVFCTSAEQFHATLQRQMEHPFAELPKRRTRGPNKPKPATEQNGGAKKGSK